jgi:hypothetical protein
MTGSCKQVHQSKELHGIQMAKLILKWRSIKGCGPRFIWPSFSKDVAGKNNFWKNINLRIPNKQDPKHSTVVHTVQSTSTSYV